MVEFVFKNRASFMFEVFDLVEKQGIRNFHHCCFPRFSEEEEEGIQIFKCLVYNIFHLLYFVYRMKQPPQWQARVL